MFTKTLLLPVYPLTVQPVPLLVTRSVLEKPRSSKAVKLMLGAGETVAGLTTDIQCRLPVTVLRSLTLPAVSRLLAKMPWCTLMPL